MKRPSRTASQNASLDQQAQAAPGGPAVNAAAYATVHFTQVTHNYWPGRKPQQLNKAPLFDQRPTPKDEWSWEDSIVAIATPRSPGSRKKVWGVGASIAGGFILTARHVLFPEGASEPGTPEIGWRDAPEGPLNFTPASEGRASIVELSKGLDVALIRFEELPERFRPLIFEANRSVLKSLLKCEAAGFHSASKKADASKQNKRRIGRYILEPHSDAMIDSLSVCATMGPPELSNGETPYFGWRGIAGAPVLLAGSNKIVSIVSHAPEDHNNRKLNCTPAWRLFECEKFHHAVSQPEAEAIAEEFRRFLSEAVNDTGVYTALKRLERYENAANKEELVDGLLGAEASSFCNDLLGLLTNEDIRLEAHTRRKLDDLVHHLMPALMLRVSSCVAWLKGGASASLIELPAETLTMAELLAAAKQRRPAKFSGNDGYIDFGRDLIRPAPQPSANGEAEQETAEQILNKINDFLGVDESGIEAARQVLKRVGPSYSIVGAQEPERLTPKIFEKRCNELSIELKAAREAKYDSKYYYLVFDLTAAEANNNNITSIKSAAENLAKTIEELPVFCIGDQDHINDREHLSHFCNYLQYRRKEQSK